MLIINETGLLVPNKNIRSSLDELHHYFVQNIPTRSRFENYRRYLKYTEDLKKLVKDKALKQWIDGSFVTTIPEPKDIDIVTFLDHKDITELGMKLDNFTPKGCWETYGVDAYIVEIHPENDSKFVFTQSDTAYWLSRFDRTRRDRKGKIHPKGFLEIIL